MPSPTPMVKVGNPGDVGVAQLTDMLFRVADVLQGCKLASHHRFWFLINH
jgi:glucan 1,3-beta-glucosidase